MKNPRFILLSIVVLSVVSLVIDLPPLPLRLDYGPVKLDARVGGWSVDFRVFGRRFYRSLELKKGLDLQGGIHTVLRADMSKIATDRREVAIRAARDVIERRVNFLGVSEANIQTAKVGEEYRINVELPGVKDTGKALELIGQTAQLDFRESREATPSSVVAFTATGLTGRDLKRSAVTFDSATGEPQVSLEFNSEGAKKFEEITRRNIGRPVAIFLDGRPISVPRVDEAIGGGQAVIRGEFDLEEAKKLSIQLNAGALPVPIEVIEQRNIGATLGRRSVEKSVVAGTIGLLLVTFFMWAYYGRLGFLADLALLVYGLVTLALYKLIPVVLTLPGVAGFILSIGMAVDANILIFERMREELRRGVPPKAAMELGFGRAWDSIRDANICTLIICFVLFNPFNWGFLHTSGMVRGFALTLSLGIFVSLFTGVVVTRTLVRVLYR